MNRKIALLGFALFTVLFPCVVPALAGDDPDLIVVTEIRQEGFRRSQVMDT
jgi:hypothetical protein